MTLDDLKRLFTRQTLFRLDAILSPKLVPILYALGLTGTLLWAVRHLFATFSTGFGNGLWGLLEIVVFGLLAVVALRIVCEAILVYFNTRSTAGETVNRTRFSSSLLDEVREAIRDLAESEESDYSESDEYITPATGAVPRMPESLGSAMPSEETAPPAGPPRPGVKRTAKRTPPLPRT
jgi:hypothetical protein